MQRSAAKRTSNFLQPRSVVSIFVAFFLAFSLFPTYAFAAGSDTATSQNQVFTTTPAPTDSTDANNIPNHIDSATLDSAEPLANNEETNTNSPTLSTEPSSEVVVTDLEPLNLIQNGNYDPVVAAANVSTYATSTGATSPSTAQRNKIKARLNTALMNVESQSVSTTNSSTGQTTKMLACVLDVSDMKAPLSTNATTYAEALAEEVINANPDLFYAGMTAVGRTQTVYTNGTATTILAKIYVYYYYDKASTIKSMKATYETKMQDMLSWVNASKKYKNSTDAEKVKAVHDWLVKKNIYNWDAYLKGGPTGYGSWDPWTSYGAVVKGKPVCQGYSLAFMAALTRLGIKATYVTDTRVTHGWNRVYIKVGSSYSWFNVDVTYDDPLNSDHYSDGGSSKQPSTTFFLKSDSAFRNAGNSDAQSTHKTWKPAGVASSLSTFDSGVWSTKSASVTSTGGHYPLDNNTHTISSISLSPTSLTLSQDQSAQLNLTVNGTNIVPAMAKWESTNPSVATVDSTGKVTTGSKQGSATIKVTIKDSNGKSFSKTCTVTIAESLSSATATIASGTSLAYTSYPIKPKFVVKLNGQTLTENTHYTITYPNDSTNPGVKTVTITGKGAYSGSITKQYTITCSLNNAEKTAPSGKTYNSNTRTLTTTYTGAAQKITPKLTFKLKAYTGNANPGTYTLKEGTDYTVTWPSDTTNAGTKSVTITGRGAWTGSYSFSLTIAQANISNALITYDTTKRYTGKAVTVSSTVSIGTVTISPTNYTMSYSNNTQAGSNASVTFTGKGNLTGSAKRTFSIVKDATWTRLWGSNAFATMQAITKQFSSASIAIVAVNTNFKDSLAAAALAGSLNAPMLTTTKGSLATQTKSELTRLGVSTVYIVGSTNEVSTTTENQIKALSKVTTVKRVTGATASARAIAAARLVANRSDTVIIATQNNFKDALAISPYAYASRSPILYAETNKSLSTATINYIKSAGFKKAIIVGGPVALPTSIETQLKNAGISASSITRLAGSNQYKTAQVIAEWSVGKLSNGTGGGSGLYQYAKIKFQPAVKLSANRLGVARADDNNIGWKDALAGAALCGKNKSVLILADVKNSAQAAAFVKANKNDIVFAYVFGGKLAVPEAAYNKLVNASK